MINGRQCSFWVSLYVIERRTRPTRNWIRRAQQPHEEDEDTIVVASAEYRSEGVKNFAACGVSLNQYFKKFEVMKFASWVIATTSFDVLNGERRSTRVEAGALLHLGQFEVDTAITYIAIKGVQGRFATDAATLQMCTRPTDEILALMENDDSVDHNAQPAHPHQHQEPVFKQMLDSTPHNQDGITKLVMTRNIRTRDMMGRPAELVQETIVQYLRSPELPGICSEHNHRRHTTNALTGWCILTRVPIREDVVRQVVTLPQDAMQLIPQATIDYLTADLKASGKYSPREDVSVCDSKGDAMRIGKDEVVTMFCCNLEICKFAFLHM
jgi:hypothetical protein